ncbi:hypothetical protein HNQ03_000229 [Chryseobacterium sp. 16F]|uniref:Uncharacterized protein n=2 Tax=Frigoriflavimonas asaccharolytica TaxID=2735899 RepID=A0A8J8G4L0_9FLAO|nr:hypothetical protein [Frigoriflavimonas asaccharolytica]
MFNTYQTDDYGFAASTNELGIWQHCIQKYFNWGGRYFAFSLNAFNPAGNLSLNWLPKAFPMFLWGNLIFGFFLNFQRYFNLNNSQAVKKSFIAFLFYTVVLASLSEHYFWLTGAIVYQLPHIFGLYFLYILGIKKTNLLLEILKYFLIFAMMGSNEIVALFLLLFLIFQFYKNLNKDTFSQFVFGLIFFCFTFFAPGNFVRMGDEETDFWMSNLKKIAVAIANAVYVLLKVGLIIPLFIAVFQAEILKIKQQFSVKDLWKFQMMLMVVLAFTGFIMVASERSLEPILIFALLSTSVLVSQYFNKIKKLWMVSLALIFIPSIMLFPYKSIYFNLNYNLNEIGEELISTDLQKFENEIADRHETLRTSKSKEVGLKPIKTVPKILYFDELGTVNNRNYVNSQLKAFYKKKSVFIEN